MNGDNIVSTPSTEGAFEGVGGLRIVTRSWHLAGGTPRAVVVIVHGFNSHSGYYQWVGEPFADNGISVHALDLRGRGKSDGERYYVEKFGDYVDDVASVVKIAKSYHPGVPVFMLGHSAGGVIACLYTLEHQAELSGLISESFAYEVPAPDFAIAALKGLSHLAAHAHVLKLNNEDFSRDPAVVAAMNTDWLIAHEVQPTNTVAELARADDRLRKGFAQITIPVLIMHGTADKAAKASGSQHFYDTVGSTDKTLKLYEGHYHDLLNDLDKEVVMADILGWTDAHIPAA